MKTMTYHIAKGTNSRGRQRLDTMLRVQIEGGEWTWFTGFSDGARALEFLRDLVRGHRVKLVAI